MPTPSVKNVAGCPHGFWLPPDHFGEEAEIVVRQRVDAYLDVESVVDWARLQIHAWWTIAATFAPGAMVRSIDETGLPNVEAAPDPRTSASRHPLGDFWPLDDEQVAKVARCQTTYSYSVPAVGPEFYDVTRIDRQCALPATETGSCVIHAL